ncbi:MAG: stage V sporulation protein AD, partial [Oscillospiraceae bacterium]
MQKRIGTQTVKLNSPVNIISSASIVGTKEGVGPLGDFFDVIMPNAEWGEETWEKTESKMQNHAALLAIKKAKCEPKDIGYIIAGDLLNQCIGSGFGLRSLNIPYFGVYGACSTMIESMSLSAMMIDGGFSDLCVAVTSSHFCTAERQYRTPLEYGGQRTPTAQWTVTGSGAMVLGNDTTHNSAEIMPRITHITTGKMVDMGIKDPNNMGGAMAPAAVDTLVSHFNDSGREPNFYDIILTGDLGLIGKNIVVDLMKKEGYDFSNNYSDCGCMIYDML